ncbi:MAG: DUF2846 domain-containing protein [Bradyrhizobiaceae bacterium]|nr:DUF2846 domain-containing protein [Bradyrhizobiaceae bacterium]
MNGDDEGVCGTRSSWQLYPAFALAAVLFGCATQSGPPLSSLTTLGAPPKALARVVVVRPEQGFFGIDGGFPVKLDGEALGELKTGTFAYLDRPAGRHQLSAEIFGYPGVTREDFTAAPGRTYFFRASANARAKDLQGFSMISPLGALVGAATTFNDRQGPIDLIPISEAQAKRAIAAQ